MVIAILKYIAVVVGLGIMGRVTGASKPWLGSHQGTLSDIFCWALPVAAACMWLMPIDYYLGAEIAVGAWLGEIVFGYGELNYINQPIVTPAFDYNCMRGAFITLFFALLLPHPIILIAAGATMVPAYWLGAKCPTVSTQFLNQGHDWGEVIHRALIGLGIVITAAGWKW